MSKFKAPSLAGSGIIRPKAVPAPEIRDDEIPSAVPNTLPDLDVVPDPVPMPILSKKRATAKAKAAPVEADPELAHRSLYARPETLELIREIAFKKRVSAQSLYRRGLLLMLQEQGLYKDKTDEDV